MTNVPSSSRLTSYLYFLSNIVSSPLSPRSIPQLYFEIKTGCIFTNNSSAVTFAGSLNFILRSRLTLWSAYVSIRQTRHNNINAAIAIHPVKFPLISPITRLSGTKIYNLRNFFISSGNGSGEVTIRAWEVSSSPPMLPLI